MRSRSTSSATSSAAWCDVALGEPQEGLVDLDRVARSGGQRGDDAGHLGLHEVLHLHRLEDHDGLAGAHAVALGHEHAHDGADQGGGDGDGTVELGRGGHRPMLANAAVRSRTCPATVAARRGRPATGRPRRTRSAWARRSV